MDTAELELSLIAHLDILKSMGYFSFNHKEKLEVALWLDFNTLNEKDKREESTIELFKIFDRRWLKFPILPNRNYRISIKY